MAGFVEITIEQGVTFKYQLDIRDEVGLAMNLVAYNVNSQMRKSHSSANATATFEVTKLDSPNGVFQLALSPANTANIKFGRYVFDTIVTNQVDPTDKLRVIEGIVTVSPGVTKD